MKKSLLWISALVLPCLLTQCETMETAGGGGTITVAGVAFYPDETGMTYVVPAGAQIVGAGGTDCHFIVQNGGSLVAHSGTKNTYKIESGGHFQGFAHPAEQCTVTYEVGAIMQQEQTGPGTQFVQR